MRSIIKLIDIDNVDWITIDNEKLEGFLDKFVNGFTCKNRVCDDLVWGNSITQRESSAVYCSYCRKWAEKVIRFDENKRLEYLKICKAF